MSNSSAQIYDAPSSTAARVPSFERSRRFSEELERLLDQVDQLFDDYSDGTDADGEPPGSVP